MATINKNQTVEYWCEAHRMWHDIEYKCKYTDPAKSKNRIVEKKGKASKFGARSAEYRGRKYMSELERDMAQFLDYQLGKKLLKEVIPQYKIDLKLNGKHITNHLVDFKIILADGRVKFIESKGAREELWRIKWKMTEAQHPEIPYLINPNEKEILQ